MYPNILYGPRNEGHGYGISRSTDYGNDWNDHAAYPGVSNNKTWRVASSLTHGDYLYASWYGRTLPDHHKVFKSTTGGGLNTTDWEDIGSPSIDKWISSIAVDYFNPDRIWVAAGEKIFEVNTITKQWVDISSGLPSYISVKHIEIVPGANEALYAATSHGLYYYTRSQGEWQYVNSNLPNVRVQDVQIDIEHNRIVVGTFGRGVWEADLPCVENIDIINITSDEIWTLNRYNLGDVSIETGNTLIIQSPSIKMKREGKIIVKPGAKLIVDGAKISSACGEIWKGIEVWGSSIAHQFPDASGNYQQGYLELDGATIENAYNAVTLWDPDDWNSTGGIIKAYNSTFKNNRRSVEFMSYQNVDPNTGDPRRNESNFSDCDFLVDDDYLGSIDFAYHVSMWEVDGVIFKSCDFSNTMTTNANSGYGIYTMDAGFQVKSSCLTASNPCPELDLIPSTFTGFYAGIGSLGTNSIRPVYVDEGVFNENGYGIKLSASDFATIINNRITVDDNYKDAGDCGLQYGVGVDLLNCNDYAVEENKFFESSTIIANSIGVLVNSVEELWWDPGVKLNEIYNNEYDGLTVGNEALGYNTSRDEFDIGLEFICNKNQNNTYDFYIKGEGIKLLQGKLEEAAGNTFSQNGNNPYSDYNNQAEWPIFYFYDESSPDEIPIYYSEKVNPSIAQSGNNCLSKYGVGSNTQTNGLGLTSVQKATYEQQYVDNLSSYNGTFSLYESLKDGGDTEGVIIDIETSWPDEMLELRAELLANSPHLSREVLYATADNTDVFPDAVIFEILAANPDEMRDEEFLTYLAEKQNPLPDYYIDILRGLAGDISYKTILQSQLSTYKRNMYQAMNIIIRN